MVAKTIYTPEEDRKILAAPKNNRGECGLTALAEQLGKSYNSVRNRRAVLLGKRRSRTVSRPGLGVERIKTTEEPRLRSAPPPFARPAWFDEDLGKLARAAR